MLLQASGPPISISQPISQKSASPALASVIARKHQLQTDPAALRQQLAAKQESLNELYSENERLLDNLHSTKRSREGLLDANQQLANQLEATDEEHSDLLSSHAKLRADHEGLQGRFEKLRAEHQGLQGTFEEHSALQQAHFQKQQQLASNAQRFVLRMLDTVVKHKQQLRCALDTEMLSHQETKGHRDELDHQLSLKTKAHDYTMALLDSVTAEAHVTAQQFKTQTAAHQLAKSALLKAERQTQSSADELRLTKQAAEFALGSLSCAHTHIQQLSSKCADLEHDHAELESQSSEMQLKLNESEARCSDLELKLNESKLQRSGLELTLDESGLRYSELEQGL